MYSFFSANILLLYILMINLILLSVLNTTAGFDNNGGHVNKGTKAFQTGLRFIVSLS